MFATTLYPVQGQRKAHLEFCRTQLTPTQVLDIQSCAIYNIQNIINQNEDLAELYRRQERLRSSNPIDDQIIQSFIIPWELRTIYTGLLDNIHRETRPRFSIAPADQAQTPLTQEKDQGSSEIHQLSGPPSDDEGYESSSSLPNSRNQESSKESPSLNQQHELDQTELSLSDSSPQTPMLQQVRTCGREMERMEFRFAMFNILVKKTRDNPCHHYTPFLQRNPPILFNTPRLRPWPDPDHETRPSASYQTFQPSPLQRETKPEDIQAANTNLSHKHTPSQVLRELNSNNQQSWSDFVNDTLSPLRDIGHPLEPPPLALYSSPPSLDSNTPPAQPRRKRASLHQPRPMPTPNQPTYTKKRLLASPPTPRRSRSISSQRGEVKRKPSVELKKKRSNSFKKGESPKKSLGSFENSDSGLVVVTGAALAAERACRKVDDEKCIGRRRSKVVPRGEEKDVNVNAIEKKKGVLKVMGKFFKSL